MVLTIIKQYNYYLGEEIELLKEQIMLEREYPGVLKAMREENAYLPDFEDNTLDIERIHLKEKKLEDKFKEQSHPKFDTTKTTKDLREILNTKNDKNPIFNFYDENR